MASSNTTNAQPKPSSMAMGIAILIILVLIAAVIGIGFLPQPYYAIGQVVIYAVMVASVAAKLRTCWRLAKATPYYPKVQVVVFWFVLGVFSVVAHLGDLFRTDNRDFISLATNLGIYLALFYALELVELLLKRDTAEASTLPAKAESSEPTVGAEPTVAPGRVGMTARSRTSAS